MQNQCSFCGGCVGQTGGSVSKGEKIAHVVAGPNVYICDICVNLCREIVDDEKEKKMLDEPTGEEDQAEAEAEQAEPPEPPEPPPPPSPVELDEKTQRLVSDLENVLANLRAGRSKLAVAYRLRDLAVDAGYELPKPGLEPDELAAVVRLARAAPEGKIDEYVAAMRKDMAAWDKAARKGWSQGHAWLGALGALGISTYLMSKLGGKK